MKTVTSRRILAVFPPTAVALLVTGEALTPTGLDKPITSMTTALKELPIATAHSGRLYFSNLLVIFGLAALAVTFSAIATLARDHDAPLASAGAVIGGIAAFCGAIVNVLIGFNLAAAATAHAPSAATVLVTANRSTAATVLFAGYLAGGVLAIAIAVTVLWRSRLAPRWLPGLFGIGLVIAAASPPGIIAVPLSVPFAAASATLAARIWQSPTVRSAGRAQDSPTMSVHDPMTARTAV